MGKEHSFGYLSNKNLLNETKRLRNPEKYGSSSWTPQARHDLLAEEKHRKDTGEMRKTAGQKKRSDALSLW